jgi:excisionase family DNA binding protein
MARQLRVEQALTVDQLAERLALPRSTIYYWVRDLPLRAPRGEGAAGAGGEAVVSEGSEGADAEGSAARMAHATRAGETQRVTRASRDAAYEEGLRSFEELAAQPTFRDFVCIYLLQGYKRDRTRVALTNSDPAVMRLVSRWIRRLTDRVPFLSIHYESDSNQSQSPSEMRRFWSETVGADPCSIRVSATAAGEAPRVAMGSSGQAGYGATGMAAREPGEARPRSRHGALTVTVEDTLLRARLQAWMHRTRESWL